MVIHITPLRKRSTYAGIGAATEAAASLTAPLLGGLLTDRLSWRWCFFIELPLIAGACIIVLFFLDLTKGKHVDGQTFTSVLRELDVLGTAIFVPAIASLLLALQWGGNKYEWSSWRVILLLCIFAALLGVFVWHQSRLGERATVPSRVLRQRNVLFGFVFSCCNNGSLSVIEYYVCVAIKGALDETNLFLDAQLLSDRERTLSIYVGCNGSSFGGWPGGLGSSCRVFDYLDRILQPVHAFKQSHHPPCDWPA